MSSPYITQEGAYLRKEGERIKVFLEKKLILDVPMIKVDQLVLFGRTMVTPQTMEELLEKGIEISYLTRHGKYIGRFQPSFSKNSILRKAQYKASEDITKSLAISKWLIAGKLSNFRTLLLRANREEPCDSLSTALGMFVAQK